MNRPTRNSILCPNCRKLISSDEKRCPHCGIPSPGSPIKNNPITRHWGSGEQLVKIIIYTNITMYLISLLLNLRMTSFGFNPLTMLSPSIDSLIALGAAGVYTIKTSQAWWWTLISANYLHGSLLHIFFNLIGLYQLSPLITQLYGPYRFFVIYTFSGVIGFLISVLAGIPLTIGASAALCGLIGSALYFGKSRGGPFGQAIYRQIGGWALTIIIIGFLIPIINNWAHIGGMAAGVLGGFLLGYHEKRRETAVHRRLAGICVAVTVVSLLWGLFQGFLYWAGR